MRSWETKRKMKTNNWNRLLHTKFAYILVWAFSVIFFPQNITCSILFLYYFNFFFIFVPHTFIRNVFLCTRILLFFFSQKLFVFPLTYFCVQNKNQKIGICKFLSRTNRKILAWIVFFYSWKNKNIPWNCECFFVFSSHVFL